MSPVVRSSRRAALRHLVGATLATTGLAACGGGGGGGSSGASPGGTATPVRQVFNVRDFGARGDGVTNDTQAIRRALLEATRAPGSDLRFPAGRYWLGELTRPTELLPIDGARDFRLLGENSTLSCRSTTGISTFFIFSDSTNVAISGFRFRDDGLDRSVTWQGAVSIRLSGDGNIGCSGFTVSDCSFETVLSALTVEGEQSEVGNISLNNLSVVRSYYGLNFQNNGNHVRGSGLSFNDMRRSYFPYGVDDHNLTFTSGNHGTGSTDILIKCYSKQTTNIVINATLSGYRGVEAIVSFEQQTADDIGVISGVRLNLDLSDADCSVDNVFLFRSIAPNGSIKASTRSVWRDIGLDGSFAFCGASTRFVSAPSAPSELTSIRIGSRLDQGLLPVPAPNGFEFIRAA